MELITIQLAKWRLARNFNIEMVDTTVRSGYSIFAPTWDMVMGHRNGTLTDEEYTRWYYDKMRESWNTRRQDWIKFMQQEHPVAIACYCPAGKFCHRHLLRKLLERLCQQQGIAFRYYGELI